jgi:hypothetical protein
MKKILTFLCIIMLGMVAYSQVYQLESHEGYYIMEDGETTDGLDINILIKVDIDNDFIKFNNNFEDEFRIIEGAGVSKNVDNDGNSFTMVNFSAIDQDNKQCLISISMWDEYNLVCITAIYPNVAYGYWCKIIDRTENSRTNEKEIA